MKRENFTGVFVNSYTYLRFIAVFLCSLMLTLPFYSAQSLAAVNIVKNSGQANIEGFVDAQNDIWTLKVNAQIAGITVTPENLRINDNPDIRFDTCAAGAAGSSDCTYTWDYRGTAILESSYPLHITVLKDDGTVAGGVKGTLFADLRGPQVSGVTARQKGKDAEVSYTVKEEPADCVGLQKIVFSSNGTVVKALEGSELEGMIGKACEANALTSVVTLPGAKSETTAIRITAFDRFGHNTTAFSNGFVIDRVAPVIGDFSIGLSDKFVPNKALTVPLTIEVTEEGKTLIVTGTSAALGFTDEPAKCTGGPLYDCTWNANVDFSKPFSLVITANDGNNKASSTVSPQLIVDKDAPAVDFFGVESSFGKEFLVKRLDNEFVAQFTETQSGIVPDSVMADFSDINAVYGRSRTADGCSMSCAAAPCSRWQCVWRGINAQKDGVVTLTSARDMVGNEMPGQVQVPVRIDDNAPTISNISIELAGGGRDYFQSKDLLMVSFNVTENQGVAAFVNTTDLVASSGVERAACTPVTVGEDEIKQGRGKVACTYTTRGLKSGHDADARVQVIARDRVGNVVRKTVAIEIFGTDENVLPDFWDKGKVRCSPEGLDINTVKLAAQRVFCSVEFSTGSSDVVMASAQLVGCVAVESKKVKAADSKNAKKPGAVGAFAGGEAVDLPFEPAAAEGEAVGTATAGIGDAGSSAAASASVSARLSDGLPSVAQSTFVDPVQPEKTNPAASDKNKKETSTADQRKPIADNHLKTSYLINNLFGSATPYVVLEFDPAAFAERKADEEAPPVVGADGKAKPAKRDTPKEVDELTYECVLRLTSKDGNTIVIQPEEETVLIKVPFFLTKFDSDLKGLDSIIEREKKAISSGFFGVIGALNEILTWVKIICTFIGVITTLMTIWEWIKSTSDGPRATVFGAPMAILQCEGASNAQAGTDGILKILEVFCGLATCSPNSFQGTSLADNWYDRYRIILLDYYNLVTFRAFVLGGPGPIDAKTKQPTYQGGARQATSLQDNLVLSVAGLCLPGVVFNLNKLRQIDCRYVACLEQDVKSGVATIEACRELRDYQECKYVWGEAFQLIPFVGAIDQLINLVKSILTDPIGAVRFAAIISCSLALCAESGSATAVCDAVAWFVSLLDVANSIASAITSIEVQTKGDYCKQAGIKAF